MKKILMLCLLIASTNLLAKEDIKPPKIDMPNLKMDTHKSKILKVFFAMDGDAKFVAYKVMWNGQEIIISDMFCEIPKNVGDELSFMSQSMEIPHIGVNGVREKRKILQFIAVPEINLDNFRQKK